MVLENFRVHSRLKSIRCMNRKTQTNRGVCNDCHNNIAYLWQNLVFHIPQKCGFKVILIEPNIGAPRQASN